MNFKSFLTEAPAQVWLWLDDEGDFETGRVFDSEKALVHAMLESMYDDHHTSPPRDMDDEALVKGKKEITTIKQFKGLDEAEVFEDQFIVIYSVGGGAKPKVIRL